MWLKGNGLNLELETFKDRFIKRLVQFLLVHALQLPNRCGHPEGAIGRCWLQVVELHEISSQTLCHGDGALFTAGEVSALLSSGSGSNSHCLGLIANLNKPSNTSWSSWNVKASSLLLIGDGCSVDRSSDEGDCCKCGEELHGSLSDEHNDISIVIP